MSAFLFIANIFQYLFKNSWKLSKTFKWNVNWIVHENWTNYAQLRIVCVAYIWQMYIISEWSNEKKALWIRNQITSFAMSLWFVQFKTDKRKSLIALTSMNFPIKLEVSTYRIYTSGKVSTCTSWILIFQVKNALVYAWTILLQKFIETKHPYRVFFFH